jgi:hypothetical protein
LNLLPKIKSTYLLTIFITCIPAFKADVQDQQAAALHYHSSPPYDSYQ